MIYYIEWANARVPPTPLRRHHEDKWLEHSLHKLRLEGLQRIEKHR